MPKLTCLCGFVHNLSPIPDDGWLTIRDRDHAALPDEPGAVLRVIELSGRLYECQRCGRLMWSAPGDRCTTFRIYRLEEPLPTEEGD